MNSSAPLCLPVIMITESRRHNCAQSVLTNAHVEGKLTIEDTSAYIQCGEDVRSLLQCRGACKG